MFSRRNSAKVAPSADFSRSNASTTTIGSPLIHSCTCTCWDTIVKKGRGDNLQSEYRTVYINTDRVIIYLVAMTIFYACSAFNMFQNLFKFYYKDKLRRGLAFVSLTMIYPNLYSYWAIFNYLNDRWFYMIRHQLFFGITEWIASAVVVYYLNKKRRFDDLTTLVACAIGLVHAIQLYGFDEDFIRLHHKFFRNLLFFLGDISLVLYFGRRIYVKKLFDLREKRNNVILFASMVFIMIFILNVVLPNE